MKIRKIASTAIILPITLVTLLTPIQAQTLQETFQEKKDTFIANRCERVTTNIDSRIERFNLNKDRHINQYTNNKNRISEKLNTLEANGLDVSVLRADLQVLDAMLIEFSNSYSNMITKLEEAKSYACGNSEGQFRNSVEEARAQLVEIRGQVTEMINYYKVTIKSDLQALRNTV